MYGQEIGKLSSEDVLESLSADLRAARHICVNASHNNVYHEGTLVINPAETSTLIMNGFPCALCPVPIGLMVASVLDCSLYPTKQVIPKET